MSAPRSSRPQFQPARSRPPQAKRRGFALLITITLLAFLVLLLVSLAALTRVETQVAANSQNLARARQNALLALNLALGELQRTTGPDQRTTAVAAIGTVGDGDAATADNGVPAPADGTRQWVGVWGNAANPVNRLATTTPSLASHEPELPALLTWLVSGNEAVAFTASTTAANFGQLTAYPSAPATLATNAPWLTANPSANTALPVTPSLVVTRVSTAGPLTPATSPVEALRIGSGATARDAVLLVGPRTRGIEVNDPAGYVAAPLVDISVSAAQIPGLDPAGAAVQVGRYAWWVGDEGAKARVDLQDPHQSETSGTLAIRRIQVAARTGIEALTGFSSWNPATFAAERLLSSSQLALVPSVTPAVANARFNDMTTFSQGVLADVSRGGLKKDLTAGLLGSTVPAEIADAQALFNFPAAAASSTSPAPETLAWSGATPSRLPSWGALRSYVRLQNSLSGASPSLIPRQTTDTQMGIFPIVTRAQFRFTGITEDNGGANRVHALYFPAVVLWNPYNVTLRAHRYAFKFTFIDPYEGLTNSNWNAAFNKGFPAFAAIHGPPLAPGDNLSDTTYRSANLSAVKGASAYITQDRGFPVVIDCPDLAPGETRIFTPDSSAPINVANPALNVLVSGYRTTFFSELVATAPASRVVRYLFMNTPQLINYNCQRFALGLNAAFSGAPHFDPSELVQHHTGLETTPLISGSSGRAELRINMTGDNSTANLVAGLDPFMPPSGAIATQTHLSLRLSIVAGTPPVWDADTLTEPFAFSAGTVPLGWTRFLNFSRPLRYYNASSSNLNGFNKWLANDNPAAPETGATLIEEADDHRGYFDNASFAWRAAGASQTQNFNVDTPDLNSAYVGVSHAPRVGDPAPPVNLVLFHLPREETGTLSLGALQHAQVHPASGVRSAFVGGAITNTPGYVSSAMPAYAIGNSLADPRVSPADIDGFPNNWNATGGSADLNLFGAGYNHNIGDSRYRRFHFDLSYLVNRALWDRYYFSSVPASGALVDPVTNRLAALPSSRHLPYDPKNEQSTAAFGTDLRDYDRASSRLLVKGAFNINSVSTEAWAAVLSSTRNLPIVKAAGGTASVPANSSPWPRLPVAASEPLDNSGANPKASEADRFRALTPAEITALAAEIVAEIKLRGPSVTLAGFVNRKPVALGNAAPFKGNATVADPGETPLQRRVGYQSLMGPLQLAIDRAVNAGANGTDRRPLSATGINDRLAWPVDPPHTAGLTAAIAASSLAPDFTTDTNYNNSHNGSRVPFSPYIYRMAAAGFRDSPIRTTLVTHASVASGGHYDDLSPVSLRSSATASPGYLMQADLLQALAPVLSARSDTFRIRTYGEVKNPVTAVVEGRAWAEAIVQRLPDFVDQTDPALSAGANLGNATSPASVNATNQRFGRRYQVVSFRWLGPDDI
ncbi:MAG: hypothetical protein H7Y06_04165 [Opitutaceae bacterium]|nr:hypothetical protein [Opitutaceae bacterium]